MIKSLICALAIAIQLVGSSLIYPVTMQVVDIDTREDLVTIQTATGFLYEFSGSEDYNCGDLVSVIMFSNGTQDITDDTILCVRYSGYTI